MAELLKYLAGRTDWPTVAVEEAERIAEAVRFYFYIGLRRCFDRNGYIIKRFRNGIW